MTYRINLIIRAPGALGLDNSSITGKGLCALLNKASKIKSITLNQCEALDDLSELTSSLEHLELLSLGNSSITGKGLCSLLNKAPKLNKLFLNGCTALDDLSGLTLSLEHLELLGLGNSSITGKGLCSLLNKAPKLNQLDLSGCKTLDDLSELTASLEHLELLGLNNSSITGKGLCSLLNKAPRLKELYLGRCTALDDLSALTSSLEHLEVLDLNASSITEKALRSLLEKAPHLKVIYLDNCAHLASFDWGIFDKPPYNTIQVSGHPKRPPLERDKLATSSEKAPAEPIHTPQQYFDIKPTPEDTRFVYTPQKKAYLNQGMVIHQASQYLTLTKQHEVFVPRLQDGICFSLAQAFLDEGSLAEWNRRMNAIQGWDGTLAHLGAPLRDEFERLWKQVYKDYFTSSPEASSLATYVGDGLREVLANPANNRLTLSNPWHAVALKRHPDGNWVLYDPNYSKEPRVLSLDALLGVVKQSLGELLFVRGTPSQALVPVIARSDAFLEHGGLLALCGANNAEAMLGLLPQPQAYSKKALEGILMRATDACPAWLKGLHHANPKIVAYTQKLLAHWEKNYPDAAERLNRSAKDWTPYAQHETLVQLHQPNAPQHPKVTQVLSSLVNQWKKNQFIKLLETWNSPKTSILSANAYAQTLLHVAHPKDCKRLVEVGSEREVQGLQALLLSYCKQTKRPVFCVNSPDELVCSADYVDSKGQLKKGPGGRLYDFLAAPKQNKKKKGYQPPVILVNYERFDADDIVRFNTLLDKERKADGTLLEDDVLVVGYRNAQNPKAYKGVDFYSRFDRKESCPLGSETLGAQLNPTPETIAVGKKASHAVINLGHASDWEERLLGRWVLKKDRLAFVPGALKEALASKKPIELQNAPWDDPRFLAFWQALCIQEQVRLANDEVLSLPQSTQWAQSSGYDWSRLAGAIEASPQDIKKAYAVNPGRLSFLFEQLHYEEADHSLTQMEGLLEQNKGTRFPIYVTRELSEDSWGLLLEACQKHHVTLQCDLAPGVSLPKAFKSATKPVAAPTPWAGERTRNPTVLTSSDIDVTVAQIRNQETDWNVIDVTECDAASLLLALHGKVDHLKFDFTQKEGVLYALTHPKKDAPLPKILLRGRFSEELLDALAPLLLHESLSGRLVLVSEPNNPALNYASPSHHQVSRKETRQCLDARMKLNAKEQLWVDSLQEPLPYARLQTHIAYQRAFPLEPQKNPWEGLDSAPLKWTQRAIDLSQSKKIADEVDAQRLDLVSKVLSQAPYVCFTGLTASGKSSFVHEVLAKQPHTVLHVGETSLLDWVGDKRPGKKLLFIDEFNLSSRQWTELEGLYTTPPSIFIDGVRYELSSEHQVVFAGNPQKDYGGERQQPSFVARHGQAILFEPLPPEYIYERLIKPVLKGSPLETNAPEVLSEVFKLYQFLTQYATNDVLITPRELQMVALLLLSYQKNHPQASVAQLKGAASYYAYFLAKPFVPKEEHLTSDSLLPKDYDTQFERAFHCEHPSHRNQEPLKETATFQVTPSRAPHYRYLCELLALRTLRRHSDNEAIAYGGLGGAAFLGLPAAGKSEAILAALIANDYQECHDYHGPATPDAADKRFYRLPVSMPLEEKKQLLLKAIDEGAVVFADEFNSSALLERFQNDVLMGRMSDGRRPQKPGYLFLGAGNPATMAGRKTMSNAMAHRMTPFELETYPPAEMSQIFCHQGLTKDTADKLVDAFVLNLEKAKKEKLTPAPTFRDAIRCAEYILAKEQLLSNLYQQIQTLKNHGTLLQGKGHAFKEEGKKATELADALKALVDEFKNASSPKHEAQCKMRFNSALKKGDKAHQSWGPLLANIVIVATIIGILAIEVKKPVTNHLFFAESAEKKRDIQQSLQDIKGFDEETEDTRQRP